MKCYLGMTTQHWIQRPFKPQNPARCLICSLKYIIPTNLLRHCKVPWVLWQVEWRLKCGHPSVDITVLKLAVLSAHHVIGRQPVAGVKSQSPLQDSPIVAFVVDVGDTQWFLSDFDLVHELEAKILHDPNRDLRFTWLGSVQTTPGNRFISSEHEGKLLVFALKRGSIKI